ncbi:MAG: tyrosine-type recombinase/integrase [Candidatus Andersenbacteria bacterium]|nr:tyrosine-type recombinase/integrase [Candidatus Andersenbacteria bacterium]
MKRQTSALRKLHADFLEDLEIGQGRSAKTVENYDHYLKRFYKLQHIREVADITAQAVRQWRRWLNEAAPRVPDSPLRGVSLATQNYYLIALRQFLKYLAQRRVAALPADTVGLAKIGEREIDVLYPEEVDMLLLAADGLDVAGRRDRALLEVLYSTGVRVAEVTRINRDDVRDDRAEIAVRGKGNKVRVVFLSDSARAAVAAYVTRRSDIDPALFVRHHSSPLGAQAADLRLAPRTVQRLIKKYAVKAGLTKRVSPHTLRHSFATDLLANGADVRQVQQLLGHASITTTQVYTHLTDIHLREVHEKFHRKGE